MSCARSLVLALGLVALTAIGPAIGAEPTQVKVETSAGDFVLQLDEVRAPLTVANFLKYVNDGFYDGTIFHRVVNGFVIQGGGYTPDMTLKPPRPGLVNESGNGLTNKRGSVAMARTADPDSANAVSTSPGTPATRSSTSTSRTTWHSTRSRRAGVTPCSGKSSRAWKSSTRSATG